jgi:DNA repair protein RecN (Recombination protein N)
VAAHADTHFVIEKGVTDGRTRTRVLRLTPDRRVEELSRMLAGTAVTETVRASARELLGQAAGDAGRAKDELKSKGESESLSAIRGRKERRGA